LVATTLRTPKSAVNNLFSATYELTGYLSIGKDAGWFDIIAA
jgi:hypothetical protein